MRRIFAKLPMIIGLVALLLVADVFLARKANERIAARHYDFLENYKPDEIDWDDKNWRQCWERRELIFYKFKTCLQAEQKSNYDSDPRLDKLPYKVYYYYRKLSYFESFKREFTFNSSPYWGIRYSTIFIVHKDGLIERLTNWVQIPTPNKLNKTALVRDRETVNFVH